MTKKQWRMVGVVVAVLALAGVYYAKMHESSLPPLAPASLDFLVATTSEAVSAQGAVTSTTTTTTTKTTKAKTSLSPIDVSTIAVWSFKGAYNERTDLIAKATADISRLTNLLGTGEYTDYTLYVSIANQYDLLGDGKNEYLYLEKAIREDATTTGLAWHNEGQLFLRLGAPALARTAFERAVAAQPIAQYQSVLVDFLKEYYPGSGQ